MKTYLECHEGTADKFWQITVSNNTHVVCYGKMGSAGTSKEKRFDSIEEAQKSADKLIAQKIKKSYQRVAGDMVQADKQGDTVNRSASVSSRAIEILRAELDFNIIDANMGNDGLRKHIQDIKDDNIAAVKQRLQQGISLHDANILSTWVSQAKAQQIQFAQLFIAIGATDSLLLCARHAARLADDDLIHLYLENGASISAVNEKGDSILSSAVVSGNIARVQLILNKGKSHKATLPKAMRMAANGTDLAMIKLLLGAGANINSATDNKGSTLSAAAACGNIEMLNFLIAQGANCKKFAPFALKMAIKKSKMEAAFFLLDYIDTISKTLQKEIFQLRGAFVDIFSKLYQKGFSSNPKSAAILYEKLAPLAGGDADMHVVNALCACVTKSSTSCFTFDDGEIEYISSSNPISSQVVPASFAAIAQQFSSCEWDAGGPMMGFAGLDKQGYSQADDSGAIETLKEEGEDAEGIMPAFSCGQNWLVFDSNNRLNNGEAALGFVSHEGGGYVRVESANMFDYKGIFLRLLADNILESDYFPEIYA